jgi:[1-hydroxy-2-(trimethylamino)ethyl]phosphonate dioxygenase
MSVTEEIVAILEARGAGAYFGEPVSVVEHGLQAAHFAQAEGAPPPLVVAALLHDIGHLLDDVPADVADWHTDARHEQVGSTWLARRFAPEVTDPVRLHVAAKRYLCATASSYFAKLSPASLVTLDLQGGPMSPDEIAAFRRERYFREAVRVRLWDDRAKVDGLVTATLPEYRELIESLACPSGPQSSSP